ncbi:HD domain-containing protein [Nocardia arthritidis]|uniref:Metal-dependent phosphohydrolase n=1 Tax=Nocardia arthritidis TaxID=228602 RepID=A0A6G9YM01_9NOCA|nr:metal-dependent phosphohydrolase [Nocardia arthritidis]QIS14325.1 metal-dependent phosphohydrolase [Nocardia arthritidis]
MSTTAEHLLERWTDLAGPETWSVGADLVRRYQEPHRRYHTVEHLSAMLHVIDELAADADDLDAVRFAAYFHDAIYEIGRPDNEERSAELAESALESIGVAKGLIAEVGRLVRLTAKHAPEPGDRNGNVLCDADLAILAASPADYAAYTAAVRAEYAQVPDEAFRLGRAEILRALAAAPTLFRTATGRARFEARARVNLAGELAEPTT